MPYKPSLFEAQKLTVLARAGRWIAAGLIISGSIAFSTSGQSQDAPPYEDRLLRLSELLGGVQYLHTLCGGEEGVYWRDQMTALLDVEVTETVRRRKFTERFNLGYRGYAATHRTCSASARQALQDYIAEGIAISDELTARFSQK
ncbi:MAG: TIGR02301 family protein [Stappiaceae bacterium]